MHNESQKIVSPMSRKNEIPPVLRMRERQPTKNQGPDVPEDMWYSIMAANVTEAAL